MSSSISSKSSGHVFIAAAALAFSWLVPNHHWPWADFYSDAWAALVLIFVAAAVLYKYQGEVTWHSLPLLAGACSIIIILQYCGGLIETPGVAWISVLYIMGFTLALLVGAAWEKAKPGQCANFIFLAILFASLGSLVVQLQQWLRIDVGDAYWLFLPAPAIRFHANLGQPNQLATLMCLGVVACAWFHEKKYVPGQIAWIFAAALAIGLALTESRTSWVVVIGSLGVLLVCRKRLKIGWGLMSAIFCWAALFIVFIYALPHVNHILGQSAQEVRGFRGGEMRLDIWAGVWDSVMQKPWLGYGWMQTSLTQFPPDPYKMPANGILRHAHNLFLEMLVYVGVPLGVLICGILAGWFLKAFSSLQQRGHLWAFFFVLVLGVHAMLEFPLHYAYFLLPLGLMLGAQNVMLKFHPILKTGVWPVLAMLGIAVMGYFVTVRDYLPVEENFFSLRFEQQQLARPSENSLPSVIALTHLEDLLWLGRVDPFKAHSDEDVKKALHVSKSMPSLVGQYKLAIMYALTGKPREAEYWLVVMTRTNRLNLSASEELRQQWQNQATLYSELNQVSWPK